MLAIVELSFSKMLAGTAFATPEQFEKPWQCSVLAGANNYHLMFFFEGWLQPCRVSVNSSGLLQSLACHHPHQLFSYRGMDAWKLTLNKHLQHLQQETVNFMKQQSTNLLFWKVLKSQWFVARAHQKHLHQGWVPMKSWSNHGKVPEGPDPPAAGFKWIVG